MKLKESTVHHRQKTFSPWRPSFRRFDNSYQRLKTFNLRPFNRYYNCNDVDHYHSKGPKSCSMTDKIKMKNNSKSKKNGILNKWQSIIRFWQWKKGDKAEYVDLGMKYELDFSERTFLGWIERLVYSQDNDFEIK